MAFEQQEQAPENKPSSNMQTSQADQVADLASNPQDPALASTTSEDHSSKMEEVIEKTKSEEDDDDDIQAPEILSAKRFIPIYIGLLLGIFIISLDNTVIATAQVDIVTDLGGENMIAWLPTTFLIGQGAFALFWGQVLASFASKHILLFNVFLFEVGSLVSALAPNMGAVLAGRTISGAGAAGMMSAAVQILAETTTLEQRAVYIGMLGSLFSVSMIAGPLIGGALTKVSWRWVFWINLPIGGVAFLIIFLLSPTTRPLGSSKTRITPLLDRIKKIDIVGSALLAVLMCAVIIPIQESSKTGWSSYKVWIPICFSLLIALTFYGWIRFNGEERSLFPAALLKDLNLVGCVMTSFLTFWVIIQFMYLIPYYYQTVRGHTPTKSGVDMLALMITVGICSIVGGVLAKKSHHYFPQMAFFPLLGAVGAGISYMTSVTTGTGLQIGSQILLGLGMGMIIQGPLLTVQANTDKRLISKATAFAIYAQRFGGGVGSSVSSAILAAQLPGAIRAHLPAGVDPIAYEHIEPSAIYGLPSGPTRDSMLAALTSVIDRIYIVGVPVFVVISLIVISTLKITNIETRKVTRKRDIVRRLVGSQRASSSPA
ncbi:MFS general substrate transporter [Acaromyces ingoldii]|uniref:MFS general substrate transporter n=1 Tax=Acaromyces ingoldii TaxID=215250 RepID=A0A316YEJ1_9BASI|nr:MFS general substrate transporter [Acaromyces ingoldii]PWN87629.1 MFS general substrate transporter [Acaromyces ingoldii]